MGIKHEIWKSRIAERADLSTFITHLTRSDGNPHIESKLPFWEIIIKMLGEGKIIPSTTATGRIIGTTPAVCFQDAPLVGLTQNIFYDQKYRKLNPGAKWRYAGAGLLFSKSYAYAKGARPVLYEKTEVAKKILPPGEHWRIVNFDLSNSDDYIDWTHEREWRHPGAFEFTIESAVVLLPNFQQYQSFIKACQERKLDYPSRLLGVINLGPVIY